MAYYDYICRECGFQFEELKNRIEDKDKACCPHCDEEHPQNRFGERLPSAPGGYKINGDNSASVRPKNAGSFRGSK